MQSGVRWLVACIAACISACITLATVVSTANAQQNADGVVNYLGLSDPLVMLLHDPEVRRSLALDARRLSQLDALCGELDVDLWASRNKAADEANRLLGRTRATADQRLPSILDARQRQRLGEIELWTLGLRSLARTDVADRFALTSQQRQKIQDVLAETDRAVAAAMKEGREAKPEAREEIGQRAERLWKDGQKQLWETLTRDQQTQLQSALGERFDTSKLGRIRMRAPEFAPAEAWLNSSPLTMRQLRGQVVIVFYWTYG